MVYLTCEASGLSQLSDGSLSCLTGWVTNEAATMPNTVDYMASGQYFGAAFTAAAIIVLTGKLVARLLTMLRN